MPSGQSFVTWLHWGIIIYSHPELASRFLSLAFFCKMEIETPTWDRQIWDSGASSFPGLPGPRPLPSPLCSPYSQSLPPEMFARMLRCSQHMIGTTRLPVLQLLSALATKSQQHQRHHLSGRNPPSMGSFQVSHPVLFCPPHRSKQSEGADKRPLNLPSSEQELSLPRWQELMKAGISRSWHLYTAKCWHLTKPLPFILCGLSTELPVAERKNPRLLDSGLLGTVAQVVHCTRYVGKGTVAVPHCTCKPSTWLGL